MGPHSVAVVSVRDSGVSLGIRVYAASNATGDRVLAIVQTTTEAHAISGDGRTRQLPRRQQRVIEDVTKAPLDEVIRRLGSEPVAP